MPEEKLNIEIELCGHKGRITGIWAREALPPWYPEDMLYFLFDFDEPQPQGILSTAVIVPAKEYSREELLAVVKKEGEQQVAETIARYVKEREASALRQQKQVELDALAKRTEELLGG